MVSTLRVRVPSSGSLQFTHYLPLERAILIVLAFEVMLEGKDMRSTALAFIPGLLGG